MRLIVNADDFGYSRGVNCGISDAHRYGVVTSATVMANMPSFWHAMALAHTLPELGIGLHFNITHGRPLGKKLSTLTDHDGNFKGTDYIFSGENAIDPFDIEQELHAQMQALLQCGCTPTHIDSHHHVHTAPAVMDVVTGYAQKMGLPVRNASRTTKQPLEPAALCMGFHAENVRTEWLTSYLESCDEDVLELMTHPGFADEPLLAQSTYGLQRVKEHAVLTSEDVKAFITARGIRLIRYDQI